MKVKSYSKKTKINYTKGDKVSVKVYNYDSKGNEVNPKQIVIRDNLVYELIKKYVKF